MNDNERELWVHNDEGLYAMWQASRLGMRRFIRMHRTIIDNYISQSLACKHDIQPACKLYAQYYNLTYHEKNN
jgi:hypothetical protein